MLGGLAGFSCSTESLVPYVPYKSLRVLDSKGFKALVKRSDARCSAKQLSKHAIGKMNGECTKRQILHFDQIHHWVRVKTGTKSALASIHGYLGRCPPILMLVNFRFEYNLQSNHPHATKPRSRKRNFRVCDTT